MPRGGGVSIDDEDGADLECEEYDDEYKDVARKVPKLGATPRSLTASVASLASSLVKATGRACKAGLHTIVGPAANGGCNGDEEKDDPEEGGMGKPAVLYTFLGRTYKVLGKMYQAAIYPDSRIKHASERGALVLDYISIANGGGMDDGAGDDRRGFVTRLARRYGVTLGTNDGDDEERLPKKYEAIVGGGSFTDALKAANSDARLLVCYISPKTKGKKGGSIKSKNGIAIPSLLSDEALKVMNRKARKNQQERTGSFYLWICDGSGDECAPSEITSAIKRLKVKTAKGQDGPILAVVYPALASDPSSGRPRVSPVLLAQHHCNPPPDAEGAAAWLLALRKRHAKQFAKMQRDRVEAKMYRERVEGYASSMDGDTKREETDKRLEAEKKEEERLEREGIEALERRREELLAALRSEPESGEGVITVALRFEDGSRDQRRFEASTTTTNDVVNWVDAVHKIEREKVILTTMNGKQRFTYVDAGGEEGHYEEEEMTLEDAGLGRMTALRVSTIVENKGDENNDEDGDEEEEA